MEDHFVKPDAGLSDLDLRHLLDAIGTDVHRVVAVLELHFHSQLSVADHHLIGKNVTKRRRKTIHDRKKNHKDNGKPKQAKRKEKKKTPWRQGASVSAQANGRDWLDDATPS